MAGITSNKKISYKDQRLTKAQQKKSKAVNSAGIKNYLGEQENVTVPKKWLSSPDHVVAELAYITPREQKILLDADLYGSLNGKPNRGPGGIMSLQGGGGGVTSDGKGGHTGTADADIDKGPAAEAAIAAGKSTSVDTKEDERRAKKEAKDFRQSKYTEGYQPVNIFEKASFYNTDYQKKQNIKVAQKRAFELAKRLEKYVHGDMDMDYDFTQDIYGNKISKGLENLISNKNTTIESSRPNLYTVNPSTKYSVVQAILDKTRPDTQVTLENTKKAMRDYNMLSVDPNISKEKLDAIGNRGKTPDQINPPSGGDNNQPFIPINYNTGAAEIVEPYTNDFVYRFGDEQNVGRDVTLGYAANGGRIGKAFGGIMDTATGRKAYGLGSIFKSVGKAVKGVAKAAGKVLKSDVGKMALMAAGTYYMGGGAGFGGKSMFGNTGFGKAGFMNNLGRIGGSVFGTKGVGMDGGTQGFLGKLGLTQGFGGLMPTLKGVLGLSAALPFIPGINKAPENEDIGMADRGGRLLDSQGNEVLPAGIRAEIDEAYESGDPEKIEAIEKYYAFLPPTEQYLPYSNYGSQGYRTTVATGGRIRAEEGGLMNLGGMEKDYRAEGGFVPIGKQEKADDVPARLSVNEFVFTADAVRNAGGGDIDKGAEVMENMMKNLENGGTVSEESQGNTGAQNMFSVSERIGEVI